MLTNVTLPAMLLLSAQMGGDPSTPSFARCPIRVVSAIPILSTEHAVPGVLSTQLAIRFDPFGPKIYGYDVLLHGPLVPRATEGSSDPQLAENGTQSFRSDHHEGAIAALLFWTGQLHHVVWFEFTPIDLGMA